MAATTSTSLVTAHGEAAIVPAILEFQSPSSAILNAPMSVMARSVIWSIGAMFTCLVLAIGVIKTDRVVTVQAKVVSQAPTNVVQPLETAIVREIDVQEGQVVRAGDILAKLDPTFAASDMEALAAQVAAGQAEVSREQAEVDGRTFTYSGTDPNLALQSAIFAERQQERNFKLENFQQQINSLGAQINQATSDISSYQKRLDVALQVEQMRKDLDKAGVGSKLNTLSALDNRLEIDRGLKDATEQRDKAMHDLQAAVADKENYDSGWKADAAQKLAESTHTLSDARQQLNKAELRQHLVDLRAETDAIVLTIAHVSVGSVLQSGAPFITLVPRDAPLEVEANISGADNGFVHVGDPVAIKFDTFQYSLYGMAYGTVRYISPDSFNAQEDQRAASTGAVPIPQGSTEPYYRARITLDDIKLHGVPAGFKPMPGMPITADIKIGKRTVLAYFLSRVTPLTHDAMREP